MLITYIALLNRKKLNTVS